MTPLVSYRSSVVTPDTAEALRLLEKAASQNGGLRIKYQGVPRELSSWSGVSTEPGPTGLTSYHSMRPTGREVYLSVELEDPAAPTEQKLAVLWSLAVPLGFMPWCRYPVPTKDGLDTVFHFLGPWTVVGDYLHGEGRGELAWPSMCAAAQCEVGTWQGPMRTERALQTHLHRLGIPCGPIDGALGEKTLASLRALSLGGLPAEKALEALERMNPPPDNSKEERRVGYLTMKGTSIEAFSSGAVQAIRTRNGYSIVTEGAGRLILLFGGTQQ